MLQGTLDMLVLRTLLTGPAHGHTIAHVIERGSHDVLQGSKVRSIRRSTASKIVVGSLPIGASARTTAEPAFTNSPPPAVSILSPRPAGGARWSKPLDSSWARRNSSRHETLAILSSQRS